MSSGYFENSQIHSQNFDTIDRLSFGNFLWLSLSNFMLCQTKIKQNTFDCIKKRQQNIEPIGDLLEQQIHIAIVRSYTKWVKMFFEVAFKDRPFRILASYYNMKWARPKISQTKIVQYQGCPISFKSGKL